VDYDGTRAMFEAFRVRMPLSTGIVQWMLNSAWPSLYWQLFDFYGVPTAGYYGTKKACQPQQLIYNYADEKIYAVSESLEPVALKARAQVFDSQSVPIGEESLDIPLGYRQSIPVFDLSPYAGKPHFVALTLTDAEGTPVADNFYSIPATGNRYDWSRANWYLTPITRYADMGFVFKQGRPDIQMDVEQEGDKYTVTLTNRSPVIAPLVIVKVVDEEGRLVVPALWSDNFITLLPRQSRELSCTISRPGARFLIDF
jgi:exo-1,4-beta-D-glucosaminidase